MKADQISLFKKAFLPLALILCLVGMHMFFGWDMAWDTGLVIIIYLCAFSWSIVFKPKEMADFSEININPKSVKKMISPDGNVVGTIELWSKNSGRKEFYVSQVKRNYQNGVFAKKEEFDEFYQAKSWLDETYAQELEKHHKHILHSLD